MLRNVWLDLAVSDNQIIYVLLQLPERLLIHGILLSFHISVDLMCNYLRYLNLHSSRRVCRVKSLVIFLEEILYKKLSHV